MDEIQQRSVESVADLIAALEWACGVLDTTHVFCRGHESCDWNLIPGAFRPLVPDGIRQIPGSKRERTLAWSFLIRASGLASSACPYSNEWGKWLSLMQHYRLPTRLLDWTESPLVAAFFALCDRLPEVASNTDSCIWILEPTKLNEIYGCGRTLVTMSHRSVLESVKSVFEDTAIEFNPGVIAVAPEHIDRRHSQQLSMFTLHSTDIPMEDMTHAGRYLCKIVIPTTAKERVCKELIRLGIKRTLIYPDLENLSHELRATHFDD